MWRKQQLRVILATEFVALPSIWKGVSRSLSHKQSTSYPVPGLSILPGYNATLSMKTYSINKQWCVWAHNLEIPGNHIPATSFSQPPDVSDCTGKNRQQILTAIPRYFFRRLNAWTRMAAAYDLFTDFNRKQFFNKHRSLCSTGWVKKHIRNREDCVCMCGKRTKGCASHFCVQMVLLAPGCMLGMYWACGCGHVCTPAGMWSLMA